jgi:hypothetical protein
MTMTITIADRFYNMKLLLSQGSFLKEESIEIFRLFYNHIIEYNIESDEDSMIVFSDRSFCIIVKDFPVIIDRDVTDKNIIQYILSKFPSMNGIIDRTLVKMIDRISSQQKSESSPTR